MAWWGASLRVPDPAVEDRVDGDGGTGAKEAYRGCV